MALLDMTSGEIRFQSGLCLRRDMSEEEIRQQMKLLESKVKPHARRKPKAEWIIPSVAIEGGYLRRVTLEIALPLKKDRRPHQDQRAFLFAVLGLKDPSPQQKNGVLAYAPFGEVMIITDPHTGRAAVQICYSPFESKGVD